jgi:hypothetical protein
MAGYGNAAVLAWRLRVQRQRARQHADAQRRDAAWPSGRALAADDAVRGCRSAGSAPQPSTG